MAAARRTRQPAILVASILVVVACGGTPPAASERQTSQPPSAQPSDTPAPAAASAEPSASPAHGIDLVAKVGDDERRVRVFVPDPAPSQPLPLLIFLHAFGETPASAIRDTRLDRLAATGDAIVAFPPASGRAWEAQVTKGLSDSDVDEVFLGGLIDQLIDRYPVDPARVYVAGFSMGAVMAGRVACRLADRIAGVVMGSGTPWVGDCHPSRPVSVMIVHGTGDGTFRYDAARKMV